MPPSKANKQSVDTTIPKNIRDWVLARDEILEIISGDTGDYKRLPNLASVMRGAEKSIGAVKTRIRDGEIKTGVEDYAIQKYDEFVKGEDNRPEKGKEKGNKKNTPFIKPNGDKFTAQDITDAMKGGNFPTGFLTARMSNKDSAEFKSLLVDINLSTVRTEETRKTQLIDALRKPTPEEKKPDEPLSKEKQAEENQKIEDAKQKKVIDEAEAEIKRKSEQEEKDAEELAEIKRIAKVKYDKAKEQRAKEKEEEEGLTIKDADEEEEKEEEKSLRGSGGKGGIGGEKAGETIKLEDVAEEEGLKGLGQPPLTRTRTEGGGEYFDSTEGQEGMNEAPAPTPPTVEPDDLPDNRGTVEEAPDILDASRGGAGMTPSSIVKGGDSSGKEDAQRSKMNIARLKEEIRALHLIYDNNIDKFRSNPHKADKDDALKSDKVEVVRKHHKDMEVAIREYYRSGGGDTLQVGVIVPIDTYLQQYLSGGKPNEQAIAKAPMRTTGKEGTTSVGLGHRDGDLKSKSNDPYSRAIAQGIYYQRGGMGSYKQRAVSGHTVKIGGKDKIGQVQDPRTRVDAVMNNFLNRAVVEYADPSLKIKT